MKIGNIVSITNIEVPKEFSVYKSIEEIDKNLPTLIVGWSIVNKYYPNFDILNKELTKNVFWTFKKTERRDIFEEDLTRFISFSIKNLVKDTKYVFIDIIQYYTYSKIKKFIITITQSLKISTYIHKDMVYISADNLIFGIDLLQLRYMGINTDKIIKKLTKISKIIENNNNYSSYLKELNNEMKYIPFLYNLENE